MRDRIVSFQLIAYAIVCLLVIFFVFFFSVLVFVFFFFLYFVFFFFFQAEDGIRDLTVTGVQTCALPISCHDVPYRAALELHRDYQRRRDGSLDEVRERRDREHHGKLLHGQGRRRLPERSEERRVGKEGRRRRWPDHEKKKREE